MNIPDSESLIYIVDDEFAVRDALTLLVMSTGQKVQSFACAESFLKAYEPEQLGCLVADVGLPGMSGLELQAELSRRAINMPIIFICGNALLADTSRAFRMGAIDFIEKPIRNDLLLQRIEEALLKDKESRIKAAGKRSLQARIEALTPREKEVLGLLLHNRSNKESAKILAVSHRTIDIHRAKIMQKMRADNIADLIMMAAELDIFKGSTRYSAPSEMQYKASRYV